MKQQYYYHTHEMYEAKQIELRECSGKGLQFTWNGISLVVCKNFKGELQVVDVANSVVVGSGYFRTTYAGAQEKFLQKMECMSMTVERYLKARNDYVTKLGGFEINDMVHQDRLHKTLEAL